MPSSGIKRGVRKQRIGVVVKDVMDKTLVVHVQQRFRHPFYGKEVTRITKCYVHDGKNEAKTGDRVRIVETRPLSRKKRWRLVDIVAK